MPHANILMVSDNTLANNKNSTNSGFSLTVNNPFTIPRTAKNVTVYCSSANIVNFFYNISAALGNNTIYYTNDSAVPQKYAIVFPDGAYDFANINQVLKTYFTVNGVDVTTIKFYAQDYTQKVSVALKSGYGITMPAGMATILGYPINSTFFNSTANYAYYDASSSAKFNTIISLNLSCSLVSSCFYNGQYSNLLATIPITASIGNIIGYTPYVPIKIDSKNLIGSYINVISIKVTDQSNREITIAEDWNATITIEWDEE